MCCTSRPKGKKFENRCIGYAPASNIPVLLGDVVVSAIRFAGKSLLFDGGPESRSRPAGTVTCSVLPWQNGDANTRTTPYACPDAASRMVNGVVANQETAWAGVGGSDWAQALVGFPRSQQMSVLVIYEDASGPVPSGDGVRERTALRYAVEIRNAANGQWSRLGQVFDNTQTINIFPCPANDIDQIRCTWAGHHAYPDVKRTDGAIRTAQIEAYASEDAPGIDVDDLLKPQAEDDSLAFP